MPTRVFSSVTFAGALALGTACRDAVAPEPQRTSAPAVTTPAAPPPETPVDTIWLTFGGAGLVAVAGDSLVLSGQVRHGIVDTRDSLTWETSDASIASVEAVESNTALLRALRTGSVTISARAPSARPDLSSQVTLRVFARSDVVSPIVVDEFSVLRSSTPAYAPKLRLHDTSAAGTARVIGLAIDMPEIGWSFFCSADRMPGAAGWSAFNAPADMNYGILLGPRPSSRAGPPTVRVIADLGDGVVVSTKVVGTIEPATTLWEWYDGADTGVRC